MRPFSLVRFAVLALVSACSGSDAAAPTPPAVAHDAEGSWGLNNHGMLNPGTSFLITMTETAGTITGTGSFSGEAGPIGRLIVTGSVAQVTLQLQIVYVVESTALPNPPSDTAQLTAVLTNRDQIDGQLTRDGRSSPFSLVRLRSSDALMGALNPRAMRPSGLLASREAPGYTPQRPPSR